VSRYEANYLDGLQPYFKSIKNSKGLKREQEAEIGKRILEGDETAVNELVEANLQFVVRTAKKYVSSGIPLEDLISEGNLGLHKAAEKFDYRKGKKFITYAVWWIKSYINDAIKEYKGSPDEVQMDEYVDSNDCCDDNYDESAEIINNEYEEKITDIQSRGMAVEELMKCLQEREMKILSLYFGLHGEKPLNLKEISNEMKMSSERVRQIVNTSITKMKVSALGGDHFDEFRDLQ
jgi:RNA polymerase sigma factor (sigma-70 family)